ncbi:hypothetical protein O1611_g3381 [Lasiodiplodia mahajangana]|uniref:Uncharacterized protein n=1 Tax=Lasiodiplodia mahajangana TaxID=1108764 RepID=A0ACC2JRY4_9PEZI|nr:hypothetical protein O1611_g3381 [Lasiodiplodia mahajangana]
MLQEKYWLIALVSVAVFCISTAAEPVQYCKYGAQDGEVDFCVGILLHNNISTDSHDLYITMSVSRPERTSKGWTAIGIGEVMQGALMFIVYGDSTSGEQPIVSIRKSIGHKQPALVTREDMNGADLRVVRADWYDSASQPDVAVAMLSIVCYSCRHWPGSSISARAKSQPWMWAWNPNQIIPVFTYDAHLDMHRHHANAGGWGNFYVDMARSVNNFQGPPSFPPIRPGVHTLGTSETSGLSRNFLIYTHGFVMGVAFLLLYPAGVVALRSGNAKAFKYHWRLQLVASIFTALGFCIALTYEGAISSVHQILGISLLVGIAIQIVLGWRHHVAFLRVRRRSWLSHSHIWAGRLILVGGWSNLITGFVLRDYSTIPHVVLALVVGFEAFGLATWLWRTKRKVDIGKPADQVSIEETTSSAEVCFTVGDEVEKNAGFDSVSLHDEEVNPLLTRSGK